MLLGYNTNGLAHHNLFEAVELLADIGYQSVAITLDHGPLNPFAGEFPAQLRKMRQLLNTLKMRSVVETGARFLLDPRKKHEPTLVSPDAAERERRVEFLCHAVDAAMVLGSDCVSLWSGVVHDGADEAAVWQRLLPGLAKVLNYAAFSLVPVGFEPEPGMFIETMSRFDKLCERLGDDRLRLTLDIGHLQCHGETPLADYIARYADRLVNVHLEDMRAGLHEHLMFGEGEVEFPSVLRALRDGSYRGGVHVELSRHSHIGPEAAGRAFNFLHPFIAA
jgi:L-ribulose-5-phosphate 3-epimerase